MSLICPLCGKTKTGESLFCPDCTVKLNSEYELSVPESEREIPNENEVEKNEVEEVAPAPISNEEQEIDKIPPKLDKKAWKKRKEDERSHSEKSYYEISRDKKTNKVRFIIVSIFILILVLIAALYIYNQHVKSENLERSQWELAQRTNTIDSYLAYMDEFPQGSFVSEAHTKIISLKDDETAAWQNLMLSENSIEFRDFLAKYPESPYERRVKNRLDSLLWESSLKENSSESFAEYVSMSTNGDIPGDYIGEAQKRLKMLTQSSPIDEKDLERIKATVGTFFTALSNISHTELSQVLAPVIVRFNRSTNVPSEKMIGELLLLAAKADAKSLRYDPEISNLNYEKMGNDTYSVNVPVQKILEENNGLVNQIKGYIVHLKLDADFKIFSFHETKPFSTAP